METRFAAPMGHDVKVMSWSSTFIFGGLALVPFAARFPWRPAVCALWAILLAVLPAAFSLFRIRGYLVTEGAVVVQMVARSKTILLEGLVSVSVDSQAMARSTRWFGNGGLFAITGRFHNAKLGDYRAYASDRPEEFAELLTRRIQAGAWGAAAGPVSEHAPANRGTTRRSEEEPC